MELIALAGLNVVALPPNNLYCQGRLDQKNVRRGVTKVKPMLQHGVRVVVGSDRNIP